MTILTRSTQFISLPAESARFKRQPHVSSYDFSMLLGWEQGDKTNYNYCYNLLDGTGT